MSSEMLHDEYWFVKLLDSSIFGLNILNYQVTFNAPMNKSILQVKSFDFAVQIVRLYQTFIDNKKDSILIRQLLRSGTSIGANIKEAGKAESTRDFIHKLGIAQKECDETLYWLAILKETNYISETVFSKQSSDANEILKMLRSSILTAKKNLLQKRSEK